VLIIIFWWLAYFAIELGIRRYAYGLLYVGKPTRGLVNYQWECWKDIGIFVSPGYWLARYYKGKIKCAKEEATLARYLKLNNWLNLWISVAILLGVDLAATFGVEKSVMAGLVFWRFLSRSTEIAYAFGKDVVSKSKPTSDLDKFDRIRLAINSYFEIVVYSAAFYFVVNTDKSFVCSLLDSLGVSTLTNVPGAIEPNWIGFVVYGQVLTTLSLVVLSLAVYVSRADDRTNR
jgi:hypothetical protein